MNKTTFKIIISSDIEYQDLCAEIYFKDNFFAIINQEEGFENLQIEIHPPCLEQNWKFNYADLMEALSQAKEILKKMQKAS